MSSDLSLEILDFNWERLYLTPNVISASKTDELGLVGEGSVTLRRDDPAIAYIPDPNSVQSYEGRWQLYEGNNLVFSGVVDDTTRNVGGDDTFTFGGKQRGILLGTKNVGRRDFHGWPLTEIYQEFLRDNIGRWPVAAQISTSSEYISAPAINAISGNPQEGSILLDGHYTNAWEAAVVGSNYIVIDLGVQRNITAVRVIPPWWDQKWYTFTVQTSPDNSVWTTQGTLASHIPLSDRGMLFEFSETAKYVKVIVGGSDNISRLAQVLVYQDEATIGVDTDFVVPWIENDDSGNITVSGTTTRITEQGSFNGDGINGHSYVTRLGSGASMTHNFRGTADAVFLTQGDSGGACIVDFEVDGNPYPSAAVAADTFQYKAFEILDLSPGSHTLTVLQISGTPQVDYFSGLLQSSYRPIEDDDGSIGWWGTWAEEVEDSHFRYQFAHKSSVMGSLMSYFFKGSSVSIIGQTGPTMGKMDVYIDGVLNSTVDLYAASDVFQETTFIWNGSYGNHEIRVRVTGTKNTSSTGTSVVIDGLMGNFEHLIYMQSSFDNNIRMLTDLSEIASSWLRFNNDGSVDLLGSIGDYSNTIIREGENEGGAMINAETMNDYSESCSAIVALVSNNEGLPPTTIFLIDNNAVQLMGLKVRMAQHANSTDPFILVRQAWSELQEFKKPVRRFSVEYDDTNVGPIQVGQTTILYSPRLNLPGNEFIRVGSLTTRWDTNA